MSYKPKAETIHKVVEYLATLQLNVYGRNMDVESGQEFCSYMDYSADDIIARQKHVDSNTLWEE